MDLPTTLAQFLTFLGTPVFTSFVVSELLDQQKWFTALDAQRKSFVVLMLSILFGLLSFALVHWVPPTAVEQLQSIYAVIIAAVTWWLGSQFYHRKFGDTVQG